MLFHRSPSLLEGHPLSAVSPLCSSLPVRRVSSYVLRTTSSSSWWIPTHPHYLLNAHRLSWGRYVWMCIIHEQKGPLSDFTCQIVLANAHSRLIMEQFTGHISTLVSSISWDLRWFWAPYLTSTPKAFRWTLKTWDSNWNPIEHGTCFSSLPPLNMLFLDNILPGTTCLYHLPQCQAWSSASS